MIAVGRQEITDQIPMGAITSLLLSSGLPIVMGKKMDLSGWVRYMVTI